MRLGVGDIGLISVEDTFISLELMQTLCELVEAAEGLFAVVSRRT